MINLTRKLSASTICMIACLIVIIYTTVVNYKPACSNRLNNDVVGIVPRGYDLTLRNSYQETSAQDRGGVEILEKVQAKQGMHVNDDNKVTPYNSRNEPEVSKADGTLSTSKDHDEHSVSVSEDHKKQSISAHEDNKKQSISEDHGNHLISAGKDHNKQSVTVSESHSEQSVTVSENHSKKSVTAGKGRRKQSVSASESQSVSAGKDQSVSVSEDHSEPSVSAGKDHGKQSVTASESHSEQSVSTSKDRGKKSGKNHEPISASVGHEKLSVSSNEDHIKHRSGSTLTRIGTEINVDESLCSLAVRPMQKYPPPEHKDCPTLFIVGARKGGSTSLYQYVSEHPDFKGINLDKGPKAGETMFFSNQNQYSSAESWEEYLSLFPKDGSMSGDSSVANLVECEVPQRILKACGKNVKIVMLLRNPVNRFESNYMMRVNLHTRTYNNSADVLNVEFGRISKRFDLSGFDPVKDWTKLLCLFGAARNLIFEGMYYVHLNNWLCNFPRENIMVINSEEFFTSSAEILGQVFDFVGLTPLKEEKLKAITSMVYNEGTYNVDQNLRLSKVERKRLLQVYEPFNRALFDILDWKTVEWN